jgi:hypothetical protein
MKTVALFLLSLFFSFPFVNAENPSDGEAFIEENCHLVGNARHDFFRVYLKGKQKGYFYYNDFVQEAMPLFGGLDYGAGGRRCPSDKTLVNFESFDCVTFVETWWALSYTLYEDQSGQIPEGRDPFAQFARNLEQIRYFGGENCGIEHRIHYFTQQMLEMERSGLLFNVAMINGHRFRKRINYISDHEEDFLLPNMVQIRTLERILSRTPNYYYPLYKVEECYQPLAQNGDIVAFAAKEDGLDVSHCGIVTLDCGELKLTHASALHEEVVVEEDLLRYLRGRTRISGMFVFRPRFDI